MNSKVASDLDASAECFNRLVAPKIEAHFHGRITRTEGSECVGTDSMLDRLAGIDGWHIIDSRGCVRGIASRIQPCDRSWDTFTVRETRSTGSETELAKRLRAIKETDAGWLFPALTAQAYVTMDRSALLSLGVVSTRDLYRFIEKGDRVVKKTNGEDGNTFLVVRFDDLRIFTSRLWTWPENGAA